MRRTPITVCIILLLSARVLATEFNSSRPYPAFQIGVTGIVATFEPEAVLTVQGTMADSPAEGTVEEGDVIVGVNGKLVAGNDPRRPLGEALLEADATDGKMTFQIKRAGQLKEVTIKIPTLGGYGKTWPVDCRKSATLVKELADKLVAAQQDDGWYYLDRGGRAQRVGADLNGCMATLFLLSTGDDAYLPTVKRYTAALAAEAEARPTRSSWHLGYQLTVLGEYYLRTGDRSVLPAMTKLAALTPEGQIAGSWGHYMNDVACGYVQSGQMNSAGVTVFLGLAVARECGVVAPDETFEKALHFFYRMPGHGSICYGDHRSEIYIDTNGRNAAIGCAMSLLPEDCYRQSAEHIAMLIADSYCAPEAGHTGGGFNVIWRGIGSMFLPDEHRHRYRRHMDELAWFYELCCLPGGGFKMLPSSPSGATRYTGENWGVSLGLTYTAPRKRLRILGAPPTKFSIRKPLPKLPWGTARDLEFFGCGYADGYGPEDDPPHVIYRMVHRDGEPSVDYCAKQMRHHNPMFRTWAAQRLAKFNNDAAYDAVEAALEHPDVRVRRAGCDAISSYTNWGRRHSTVIPREVVSERFVPRLEKMLGDPKAAWWEIDGALWALAHAQPEDIRRNMPTIRKFAAHDEWYLRESAYWAIVGLQEEIRGEEFLFLADMFVKSRAVFERSSYDGGVSSLLRCGAKLGDQTIAAYVRKIGHNVHSSLIEAGYDEQAAAHEATHRAMMVLKRFENAPYELILPDFITYLETWQPGFQHSNWLITGSGWQHGLIKVAEMLGQDAGPLVAAFGKCLARVQWDESNKDHAACREAMQKAVADYRGKYGE